MNATARTPLIQRLNKFILQREFTATEPRAHATLFSYKDVPSPLHSLQPPLQTIDLVEQTIHHVSHVVIVDTTTTPIRPIHVGAQLGIHRLQLAELPPHLLGKCLHKHRTKTVNVLILHLCSFIRGMSFKLSPPPRSNFVPAPSAHAN